MGKSAAGTRIPGTAPGRMLFRCILMLCIITTMAACRSSSFERMQVLGQAGMVSENGKERLWVFLKQEETRQVSVGSRRNRTGLRTDTFFHFMVQAFDPQTARPLWTREILVIGDAEARGSRSRVIGSDVSGRMLGQDGDRVWVLIGAEPIALNAADGKRVADAQAIEAGNPQLKGLLAADAGQYRFDQGLVFMSADAREFVIRGPGLVAETYVAPPRRQEPAEFKPNGMPVLVPMRAIGEAQIRQVRGKDSALGLYTEKEATDAVNDTWGGHLKWPYSISSEGPNARRSFWNLRIEETQSFDERFLRLTEKTPVADSPVFLNGRFLLTPGSDEPLELQDPAGWLVWHVTRIDSLGRVALTRLDHGLRVVWTASVPLSENSTMTPRRHWLSPDHVLVMGYLNTESDGVHSRVAHLASIALADGQVRAWNLEADTEVR